MSPLRVCTYTNVKRCSNFEPNLSHVPSTCIYIVHTPTSNGARSLSNYIFCYSTESRQTSHVTSTCIYIHQHQTLLVFCATTYSVILQNRGRQVMSPLRVYTYTNIKRGLYFATYSVILQNRGRQGMSPLRVYTYTNVKRCLYFAQ